VTLLPEALANTSKRLGWDPSVTAALGAATAAADLGLPRRGAIRSDHRADLVIHGLATEQGVEVTVLRGGIPVRDPEGPRLPDEMERIR